jgi:hypothetical protein
MSISIPRRFLLAVMGLVGAAALVVARAGDDRTNEPTTPPSGPVTPEEHDRWMRLKLISSQRVFEGLTSGDFVAVERNARRMQVLHLLEQWLKEREFAQRSEYQGQLHAFEFAVKELIRHGADRDSEGALEAYVALSRSCVRCHQLLRDVPPGQR